jgi:hypothetical protein
MRTDPNGTPARRLMELRHLGFDVAFVNPTVCPALITTSTECL